MASRKLKKRCKKRSKKQVVPAPPSVQNGIDDFTSGEDSRASGSGAVSGRDRAVEAVVEHLVRDLSNGKQRRPSARWTYRLQPDPLDPGYLLQQEIVARVRAIAAQQTDELRAEFLRYWQAVVCGEPRAARNPVVWICFGGESGCTVASDWTIPSADTAWLARRDPGSAPVLIRRIETVEAIGCGDTWDVTAALRDGARPTSPAACRSLESVRVTWAGAGADAVFPGMIWDVRGMVASRLQTVRVPGSEAELKWDLDHDGRVLIPPQPVPGGATDRGALAVELSVPLTPGELRGVGRIWSNAVPFEVTPADCHTEGAVPPPHAFTQAIEDNPALTVEQPFAALSGRDEETEAAWTARVCSGLRHRQRAVTKRDYRDIIAAEFPEVSTVDVAATVVRTGNRFHRVVRICLAPADAMDLVPALDLTLSTGRRIQRHFSDKVLEGVQVLAGPPTLRLDRSPVPTEPLWWYAALLHDGKREDLTDGMALRPDGTWWPVRTVGEFAP